MHPNASNYDIMQHIEKMKAKSQNSSANGESVKVLEEDRKSKGEITVDI